jgi:hypothetical protein
VAWQWKANGGTTASNTDGSITSTVQANKMQGLVLLLTQQQVQQQQLGHGLGAKPDVIMLKKRGTEQWAGWLDTSLL